MTRAAFRICVLIPVVTLVVSAWAILVRGHPHWPEAALQYVAWYQGSAPTAFEYWSARAGLVGLLGLLASSTGVLLFWSPAHYAYLGSSLLAVVAELPTTPVLVGRRRVPLDNLAKIFLGVSLALMFTQPCSPWFSRALTIFISLGVLDE